MPRKPAASTPTPTQPDTLAEILTELRGLREDVRSLTRLAEREAGRNSAVKAA